MFPYKDSKDPHDSQSTGTCKRYQHRHNRISHTSQNTYRHVHHSAEKINLEGETDAKGRKITVHKLPIPDHPVCVTREELEGYVFEEGEDVREEGERLAASYVNFYFSNGAVVLPAFGGENEESDRRAAQILGKLCPDREIIPVYARDILTGGGNIHCITQQIPAGKRRNKQKR